MTASQLREKIQAIESSTLETAKETILENKEYIIALVVSQHEEQHIDSLGNPLRPYSPPWKQHKLYEGKSGETDFDETGAMHGQMNLTVVDDQYFIDSPAQTAQGVLKSEFLKYWQDAPIMDLTPENKGIAKEYLTPLFVEKLQARF